RYGQGPASQSEIVGMEKFRRGACRFSGIQPVVDLFINGQVQPAGTSSELPHAERIRLGSRVLERGLDKRQQREIRKNTFVLHRLSKRRDITSGTNDSIAEPLLDPTLGMDVFDEVINCGSRERNAVGKDRIPNLF